jgi:O-antigen/teichoic acid export membrane protein
MLLNLILNLIMIPLYGIVGSAIATLITYTISVFLLGIFRDTKKQFHLMIKAVLLVDLVKIVIKNKS